MTDPLFAAVIGRMPEPGPADHHSAAAQAHTRAFTAHCAARDAYRSLATDERTDARLARAAAAWGLATDASLAAFDATRAARTEGEWLGEQGLDACRAAAEAAEDTAWDEEMQSLLFRDAAVAHFSMAAAHIAAAHMSDASLS